MADKETLTREITYEFITEILAEAAKTAAIAANCDLTIILEIVANARRKGKETELANLILEYGMANNLHGLL